MPNFTDENGYCWCRGADNGADGHSPGDPICFLWTHPTPPGDLLRKENERLSNALEFFRKENERLNALVNLINWDKV